MARVSVHYNNLKVGDVVVAQPVAAYVEVERTYPTEHTIEVAIGDLQPGDEVPGFGTVRKTRLISTRSGAPRTTHVDFAESTHYWPTAARITVARRPKLYRRTIVVEGTDVQVLSCEWSPGSSKISDTTEEVKP